MKKILILLFIIPLAFQLSRGQTATVTITDYEESPGLVNIPIDVTNFINVGAITINLEYDENVLGYNSFTSSVISSAYINTYPSANGYTLGISWTSLAPLANFNGELIVLTFNYLGGSSAFDFLEAASEIADFDGVAIPTVYFDGSIAPTAPVPISIISQLNQTPQSPPNNYVEVPIDVDFSSVALGVGSFNFEIEYDNTILTFDQINNPYMPGIGVNILTNPARVSIIWTATYPGDTIKLDGVLLNMRFTYNGGNSDLSFLTTACEVADYDLNVLNTAYTDGEVTQDPLTMTNIIIGSTSAQAGDEVILPVTVTNFNNVGAFDFTIDFDSPVLQFVELTGINPALGTGLFYNTSGALLITWNATSAGVTLADNEVLFNIKFNYSGTDTDITFDEVNCIMSDWDLNPINPYYVDGHITEIPGGNVTVSLDTIAAPQLSYVLVPVKVTGFLDVGAITLEVNYNESLVQFFSIEDIHDSLSYGSYFSNGSSGTYTYSWTVNGGNGEGIDIPNHDTLFNIKFWYISGNADLEFNVANCEIADWNTNSYNVFYSNGLIKSEVEVQLKAFLQGPYDDDTHQMKNDLNTYLLTDQPGQPFNRPPWNYTGTETLPDPLDADVVDWILVELRDATDESVVLEKRAALIYQDGSIDVIFDNAVIGQDYYLAVWSRNHMPVMSVAPVTLPNTISYDFSVLSNCYKYDTDEVAIELETGIYGLIAGDINSDGKLIYSGGSNDRGLVLAKIIAETGSTIITGSADGYFDEDVLMNHNVRYSGSGNDRGIIAGNLTKLTGSNILTLVYTSVIPGAIAKSEVINDGPINIHLNETANELQVLINTDEAISDGLVDNVQFTLSWNKETNNMIIPLLENVESSFGLTAQGNVVEEEGMMYLAFVSVLPVELPSLFSTNDEILLMSITKEEPITLDTKITIADNSFTNNNNGSYYISLFGENKTGAIHTSILDINELSETGLSIYPNPTSKGSVYLEMSLEKSQLLTISILDIHGRGIVVNDYHENAGLFKTEINLINFDKGIYFVKVKGDHLNTIKKLIIQ